MAEERKYLHAPPDRHYSYTTTLGIDWGSVGVRAKLYQNLGGGTIVDERVLVSPITDEMSSDDRALMCQFSPSIYPFDITGPSTPGKVYPGNKHDPSRRAISSKLGMYAVVGISDEVASQSSELQALRELVHQKPELKQIIRQGIEQIMCRILERAYLSLCQCPLIRSARIDAVALTVPAQWSMEFEEEYGERFVAAWAQTFHMAAPRIIFLTEGQANVHYAFYRDTTSALYHRLSLSAKDLFNIGRSSNAVLLVDAGGHSTNCSLVTICQDDNQLEISPDRGVLGGASPWAWNVIQLVKATRAGMGSIEPMSVEAENDILTQFHARSPHYIPERGENLDIWTHGPTWESFHCVLTPQELVKTFEDANARTFALIEEGLLQLKDLQPICEKTKIVIGGGSSNSCMWVGHMDSIWRRHQMERPIYLWQIDPFYDFSRLASGANYALAKAKSVAQFVDKAAFGLAVKKGFRGAHGWTEDWHYQANLLWAQGKKWVTAIKTDGTEEFKIICQPEFDNPRPESIIEPNYKSYDLLPIPCRKEGLLQFDFEIDTDTDQLKLTVKHRGLSESGKTGRSTELGNVEFDLWVPPGSRCLQIWDCVEDIERKVTAAFSEKQEPSGNNDSQDVEAEEMEVDSGAEEQPIQQSRSLRRSLRGRASQAVADVETDAAAPNEEDQDGGGNLSSPAPIPQPQAGPPQQPAEDVEMGGMEDAEEIADCITVAPAPEEPSEPAHAGGQAAQRRRRRRGSRVPRGIFAL